MKLNVPELFLDDEMVERTYRLGRTIRPRFLMHHTELYSFKAAEPSK